MGFRWRCVAYLRPCSCANKALETIHCVGKGPAPWARSPPATMPRSSAPPPTMTTHLLERVLVLSTLTDTLSSLAPGLLSIHRRHPAGATQVDMEVETWWRNNRINRGDIEEHKPGRNRASTHQRRRLSRCRGGRSWRRMPLTGAGVREWLSGRQGCIFRVVGLHLVAGIETPCSCWLDCRWLTQLQPDLFFTIVACICVSC